MPADDWGGCSLGESVFGVGGKSVWFELRLGGGDPSGGGSGEGGDAGPGGGAAGRSRGLTPPGVGRRFDTRGQPALMRGPFGHSCGTLGATLVPAPVVS